MDDTHWDLDLQSSSRDTNTSNTLHQHVQGMSCDCFFSILLMITFSPFAAPRNPVGCFGCLPSLRWWWWNESRLWWCWLRWPTHSGVDPVTTQHSILRCPFQRVRAANKHRGRRQLCAIDADLPLGLESIERATSPPRGGRKPPAIWIDW